MSSCTPTPSSTFAIIVTYANRSSYVTKLADVFFSLGISKVIIVDNGSVPASEAALREYSAGNPRILLKRFETNEGTASAFRIAMETAALDPQCEFIWILDDDNIPCERALSELIRVWDLVQMQEKSFMLMLSSYRDTKPIYRKAVLLGKPDMIIGHRNHFRAFHLAHIINAFNRKKETIIPDNASIPDFGEISAAPYGGMFFHKNLLRTIGYPDPKFYIYCDDHEFSHRLILRGGKILAVLTSTISDIEASWNCTGLGVFNIAHHENRTLLYYSVRNRVFLELRFTVNNYITYFVNAAIYAGVVTLFCIAALRFGNLRAFLSGIWDGFSGKMKINRRYVLSEMAERRKPECR